MVKIVNFVMSILSQLNFKTKKSYDKLFPP